MSEGPENYTHQVLSCELRLLTSVSNGLGGMREAITIHNSSLERATELVFKLFCIIFHAEADFEVKAGPNLKQRRKKRAWPHD